jgi:hypothetical protein
MAWPIGRGHMGTVIKFPDQRVAVGGRAGDDAMGATIIILPVIRIERGSDEPSGGVEPGTSSASGRKRRRRPR